ncbi:MAG: type II toxin-antitoxin system ParD family antitoxin [Syntrophobacteraceae bacterium]
MIADLFLVYKVGFTDRLHSSASDVVRAALRLLEEQEAKLSALRIALDEGEQSGPSTLFDFESFIAQKRRSHSAT